jgi:hypothetical protein
MCNFQIPKSTARSVGVFLTAGLAMLLFSSAAQAVTSSEADFAFDALNKAYWDPAAKFFRKDDQGTKKADFWFEAQLWDTVMDQYDRTHGPAVRQQIDDVYDGFVQKYPDWTKNKYNDDIMWWTIACTRAYQITHNERYLKKAKDSFDFVYNNFTDDTLGGGIYWINQKTSKNSCVNCPAVIAAARLSKLLNDPAYLEKAQKVYAWQKKTWRGRCAAGLMWLARVADPRPFVRFRFPAVRRTCRSSNCGRFPSCSGTGPRPTAFTGRCGRAAASPR